MANSTNSLSHTKWLCKYHIVIVPKYLSAFLQTEGLHGFPIYDIIIKS